MGASRRPSPRAGGWFDPVQTRRMRLALSLWLPLMLWGERLAFIVSGRTCEWPARSRAATSATRVATPSTWPSSRTLSSPTTRPTPSPRTGLGPSPWWSAWPTSTSIARFAPAVLPRPPAAHPLPRRPRRRQPSSPPGWRTTTPADDASSASSAGRVGTQPPDRPPPGPGRVRLRRRPLLPHRTRQPRRRLRQRRAPLPAGGQTPRGVVRKQRLRRANRRRRRRRRERAGARRRLSGASEVRQARVGARPRARDETDVRPRVLVTHIPFRARRTRTGRAVPSRRADHHAPPEDDEGGEDRQNHVVPGLPRGRRRGRAVIGDATGDDPLGARSRSLRHRARRVDGTHARRVRVVDGKPETEFRDGDAPRRRRRRKGGMRRGGDGRRRAHESARIAAFDTCALPEVPPRRSRVWLSRGGVGGVDHKPRAPSARGVGADRVAFARAFGVDPASRAPLVAAAWRHCGPFLVVLFVVFSTLVATTLADLRGE